MIKPPGKEWLIGIGRSFYAVCLAALGIQQFQYGDFRPVIIPEWPSWIHGSSIWAYIAGIGLVAAAAQIMFNRKAETTALVVGGTLLLLFVAFHIPYQLFIIPYSFHLALWTDALKELALSGGAFVMAGFFRYSNHAAATKPGIPGFLEKFIPPGKVFFSIMLIAFGIDHFLYTEPISKLIPSWMPGSIFWTYFAAIALIGSGVAILFNILLKPIAFLLAIMLLLWVMILHIPRAVAHPYGAKGNEVTSVFEALAFSGIALVIGCMHKKHL